MAFLSLHFHNRHAVKTRETPRADYYEITPLCFLSYFIAAVTMYVAHAFAN